MPNTLAYPARRAPVSEELVARRIYLIRGRRAMLDSDLAELYQVPTKALNLAVRRNAERFPADFMFRLTPEEFKNLRFQSETSSSGYGGRRYPPYAFTEHGVAMLSAVLRSQRAVQMSILIVRAFVKLRELLATNKALAGRIEQLTGTVKDHAALFDIVVTDIQKLDRKFTRELLRLKAPPRRKSRIGFYTDEARR
jgi:phage regulator Rha-like protein